MYALKIETVTGLNKIEERASKVRKETEDFLNQWINDRNKGWPLRSDIVNGYQELHLIRMSTCCTRK